MKEKASLFQMGLRSISKEQTIGSVVLLTALFYLIFTMIALWIHDWNPLWFVWVGEKYANLDPNGRMGYDGQFVYYIASYGEAAIPHLDNAPYRLQRILFPATIRLLSFGSSALVPWLIILVNGSAIVFTTYILAKWLRQQALSPWYALMYAFYIGTFMAFSRDLNEPFAFCLGALGATRWLQKRQLQALLLLALAALAKETALLFLFGIICSAVLRQEFKEAVVASLSALPLLVWEGYLFMTLGTIPLTAGPSLERLPLIGILPHLTLEPGRLSSFFFVALPALLLLAASLGLLFKQRGKYAAAWWLFLHSLFIVLLPLNVYDHIMHAGRNATGLVLCALFLTPLMAKPIRLLMLAYWVLPTLIWLIPVLRWAPWLSKI